MIISIDKREAEFNLLVKLGFSLIFCFISA